MTFLRPLPPTSAGRVFELRSRVLGVFDKGKAGSVVETEMLLVEKGGEQYAKIVGSAFFIGEGEWGGPKGEELSVYFLQDGVDQHNHLQGPSTTNYPIPKGRKPDAVHTVQTSKETAHLYRFVNQAKKYEKRPDFL